MIKALSTKHWIFGGFIIAALLVPLLAFGAEFRVSEQATVGPTERVSDDLYIAGGNVNASGEVTGDLLGAGGSVLQSGTVGGDLYLAGGSVTVLGSIRDDVRVMGGNLVIHAGIGGDVVAAGGQVTITGNEVGGDVVVAGGAVRIDSPVRGDVKIVGGDILITSAITGNVELDADKIVLAPGATIGGNLTYSAPTEFKNLPAGQVKGTVTYTPREARSGAGFLAIFLTAAFILKFLALLAAALALGLFFRRYTITIVADAISRPFGLLARGLVFLIVAPVVSGLLLATIVGIPLGVLGFLGFAAACLVGWILSAIYLGSLMHRWVYKPEIPVVTWKTITAGAVALSLLTLIPIVGWLIQGALFLIVLGAAVLLKWSAVKEWR